MIKKQIAAKFLVVFGNLLPLMACTQFPPRFYQVPVHQGHSLTKQNLKLLKIGMQRTDVYKLVGQPSFASPQDKWVHYLEFETLNQKLKPRDLQVSLKFEQNKLVDMAIVK